MRKNNGIIIFDLDMYSNRIGFFSNNRERIGSWFGLFLTLIYILALFIIFIIYSIDIIKRNDIRVYDSKIFSNTTPSIEINSNDLNLAFSLEDIYYKKYIDPSIYYPQILYIENIKNDEGKFETIAITELNYSICNNDSFGENYKSIFGNIEFNNSYCLEDFNLSLSGGFKYDRMNYIIIHIMPCLNNSNELICKPKEVIEKHLTRGYFSLYLTDIGLNPQNYYIPILPTYQNIYTSIDKSFFRDIILNFGITEIQTDTGLFYESLKIEKYLQFMSENQYFYFRNQEDYNQGKQLCSIHIRLDDSIHIQKRTYKKIPEIFSLIGGYMQLLSTIFSLISILTNLDLEVKILNNLFDFNLKQNRMSIKINNVKDFNLNKHRNYKKNNFTTKNLIFKKLKNKINRNIINVTKNNNSLNNISKNNLVGSESISPHKNITPIINRLNKCEENGEITHQNRITNLTIEKSKKSLFFRENNSSEHNNGFKQRTKSFKGEEKIYFRPIRLITGASRRDKNNDGNNNENDKNIHLNLINYYCCGNICGMKKHIELFDLGVSLYRKRMDIINVFTILLLSEKILMKLENKQKTISFKKEDTEIPIVNKK